MYNLFLHEQELRETIQANLDTWERGWIQARRCHQDTPFRKIAALALLVI